MANLIKSFSYKPDKEPIISELGVIAAREKKDASKIIVELIEEYVRNHAEGNSTFKLDNWNEDPDFQALPTFLSNTEKWIACYKNSNEKDRTKLRIQANHLAKLFPNIDFNENRK